MGKTDYPTDDAKTLYLEDEGNLTLTQILAAIKEKWPNAEMDNISIQAEHRHVTCLGYDRYDSSDYQNYIVIKLN